MAILYGTQSNGETLPVLVDQFGNLIAKGIEGQPGPPGPPGVGELPPDPFEGAILGWQDGELAWLGGSVPLPAGTYGPFEYSNSNGTLICPQDVSALVNGQQLLMTNEMGQAVSVLVATSEITNVSGNVLSFSNNSSFDLLYVGQEVQQGVQITEISSLSTPPKITVSGGAWQGTDGTGATGDGRFEPSQIWSSAPYFTGDPTGNNNQNLDQAFRGTVQQGVNAWATGAQPPKGKSWLLNFTEFSSINKLEILCWADTDANSRGALSVNGNTVTVPKLRDAQKFAVPVDKLTSISWSFRDTNQGITMQGIYVNGQLLVNTDVPGAAGETRISENYSGAGSVSLVSGNTIVLRNNNRQWINNYYVTAPEQRIAARKVATSAIRKTTK